MAYPSENQQDKEILKEAESLGFSLQKLFRLNPGIHTALNQ